METLVVAVALLVFIGICMLICFLKNLCSAKCVSECVWNSSFFATSNSFTFNSPDLPSGLGNPSDNLTTPEPNTALRHVENPEYLDAREISLPVSNNNVYLPFSLENIYEEVEDSEFEQLSVESSFRPNSIKEHSV